MPELAVQIVALLALCTWVFAVRFSDQPYDWRLLAGAGLFAAVPLIQLIPLPPSIWHALPGRETEIQALSLLGEENSWQPISLAPFRTLSSALALIPPLILLFFVSRLSLEERTRMLGLMAVLACLSVVVGAVQLASGNAHWLRLYGVTYSNTGFATGFQANRNSLADVLCIGIVATAAFVSIRPDLVADAPRKLAVAAVVVLLLFGILLSGSRAGMALSLLALGIGAALHVRRIRVTRKRLLAGGAAAVALALSAMVLWNNPAVQKSVHRFDSFADARPDLWIDTVYAIRQYWPVGSGVGTFVQVFLAAERLEVVDTSMPNRAHNDYLEFTLEAGLLGWAILLLLAIGFGIRAFTTLRSRPPPVQLRHIAFGFGALAILALHSIVDYPVRTMALAGVCALAFGMFARARADKPVRDARARRPSDKARAFGETMRGAAS